MIKNTVAYIYFQYPLEIFGIFQIPLLLILLADRNKIIDNTEY